MTTQFIVHEPSDCVGVVVVDQVNAGEEISGWVMETDETISIRISENVPLGHKLALKDISLGETIFKYGQDIGKAFLIAAILFGSLLATAGWPFITHALAAH